MDLLGKTTIHPAIFFTGKIAGYLTWINMILSLNHIYLLQNHTFYYNTYFAYFVLSISLIFVIFSLINLGKSTRFGLPKEDTAFKTNGLYKISRNPMYVGFNLMTIAAIIYTLNPIILLLGVYSILVYHFIILGEEKFLTNRFKEDYIKYRNTVKRYL